MSGTATLKLQARLLQLGMFLETSSQSKMPGTARYSAWGTSVAMVWLLGCGLRSCWGCSVFIANPVLNPKRLFGGRTETSVECRWGFRLPAYLLAGSIQTQDGLTTAAQDILPRFSSDRKDTSKRFQLEGRFLG